MWVRPLPNAEWGLGMGWGDGRVWRSPAGIPLELAWGNLAPALPAIREADITSCDEQQ